MHCIRLYQGCDFDTWWLNHTISVGDGSTVDTYEKSWADLLRLPRGRNRHELLSVNLKATRVFSSWFIVETVSEVAKVFKVVG